MKTSSDTVSGFSGKRAAYARRSPFEPSLSRKEGSFFSFLGLSRDSESRKRDTANAVASSSFLLSGHYLLMIGVMQCSEMCLTSLSSKVR